jgi:hypothetical protein
MTLRASLGFCHLSLAVCILSSLLADGSTFVVAIFSGERRELVNQFRCW